MSRRSRIPAARRPELLVRPLGNNGEHVVKDRTTGAFYKVGEHEAFLLDQLDGRQSSRRIRRAFAERFGQPLSSKEFDEFLELAESQGFLEKERTTSSSESARTVAEEGDPFSRQSLLYWRKSVFDPDRLFNWLAPRLAFCWTRTFFVLSAGLILLAGLTAWSNTRELIAILPQALRWETIVLGWLTIFLVTLCHEFAHGLTCKHHGGEVHEVGFLLIFFIPCFYVNVSDAWLLREKSKRLWVTLAGGWCDLVIWALAVLVWRLTLPGSMVHYLAWVVLSVCGVRIFFNFNPLMRLDGYYLLSDWLEIPNLRPRATAYVRGHLHWLLWGAQRPTADPRGRLLLLYGVASWTFTLVYLVLLLVGAFCLQGKRWGLFGAAGTLLLAGLILRALFKRFSDGEIMKMLLQRHKRTLAWIFGLGTIPILLTAIKIDDRASGHFRLRAMTRAELRAEVSGFLKTAHVDEGERVSAGTLVATLEVPDLASKLSQKREEVREVQARLRLLEEGVRPEAVAEQRERVARARTWRDLARQDLTRKRRGLAEDMARLGELIGQYQTEVQHARVALERVQKLFEQKAVAEEQHQEAEKQVAIHAAKLEQAQAQRREREVVGTVEAEAELARREKDLADAEAALRLLEAGSRPDEIEAEQARLARLVEEVSYLQGVQSKLRLVSPVNGVIGTARLKEKTGQYYQEGDLICEIEDTSRFEAEIPLEEQEVTRVQPGQVVELKVRSLPFKTFPARVDRVSPVATRGEGQSTVMLCCPLEAAVLDLRPGMTGYARVFCGRRAIGAVLVERVLRYLRTEFWW